MYFASFPPFYTVFEFVLSFFQSETMNTNVFSLSDGNLAINGIPLLSEVPSNVSFSTFSSIFQSTNAPSHLLHQVLSHSHKGGFLGFSQPEPSNRLTNSLGKFQSRDFLSIFRFKTWWSTMWVGNSGSDLQMETQWVLLDVPELSSYVLVLPLIEGSFRSALHPGNDGHVLICAESGSTTVLSSSFTAIAYVHVSDNPFAVMKQAYTVARVHLNTFRLLEEKTVPSLINKFGWCTWDAFYLTVDPVGVFHGLKDFSEGGIPPRFLIIDDGWQSISLDGQTPLEDAKNLVLGGTQMTARLYRFEECDKFKKYKGGSLLSPRAPSFDTKKPKMLISKAVEIEQAEKALDKAIQSGVTDLKSFQSKLEILRRELNEMFGGGEDDDVDADDSSENSSKFGFEDEGMKAFIRDVRSKFSGLDDVYVWHALCGAWGGVRPGATHLNSKLIPVELSPGLAGTMNDLAVVKIIEGGIALVYPDQANDFFDAMHSYLSNSGITGVKVDVIHTLEYVCEDYGGRVELAKKYYKGITDSLIKNFNGNGLISSMQQCNDFFFLGTWQISFGRVGDDFWFQDPNGDPMGVYWLQGVHMMHCAYNSLWMGEMIWPDWDMFKSDHECAKFHGGSRAISGGPVYVSDSVGDHDFELIKMLVFPDGTIPKCERFALPTRDCLFKNPLFDGQTILKIWNINKFGGVIGAFNCQGGGWDSKEKRIKGYSHCYKPISGKVQVRDIEWEQGKEEAGETYAVYLNQSEQLLLMTFDSDGIEITIQPSSFEIFTFVPVKIVSKDISFAPIGLVNMFNSGGTVVEFETVHEVVRIKIKGEGKFLAYSSEKPKSVLVNGIDEGFEWFTDGKKLMVSVSWVKVNSGVSQICVSY
ncbi:LOW QUALITY PROTEIN: stachyose synthase [Dioscorea cayenensis subsp. rotundata]|uniref:LOW QUALITY PROTEIN: stachyose synthase n=1 Tax=Dioscorea cayennensis subsp. rotundata TaxID=55577 RepID=A0AB40D499_DIOCR|nr:LOW QUALITY PROTEIN: stachyose synthase [Dioscorea cayenensis subsp. rotundata]